MKLSMVCAVCVAFLLAGRSVSAAPGPDCSPAVIGEMPARIRNMCAALYQFSSALQQYMDENPTYQQAREVVPVREPSPIYENGVKRQDLDHVFLRFGRRR